MSQRRVERMIALYRSQRRLRFALCFMAIASLVCFASPLLGRDPNAIDVQSAFAPLSLLHPLGTDELGRDFLLRVLYGGRVSIGVALLSMLASAGIGTILGMLAGYGGGVLDAMLMGAVDVLSSIPWMLLIIAVQLLFRRGIGSLILVIVLLGWSEIARLVRNQTRAIRRYEYVEYAQLCGVPAGGILIKHVLAACSPTVLVAAGTAAAKAILMESTLSFLNLGIQPPEASWGSLLQGAQKYLMKAPLQAFVPGLLIVGTVYSITQIGNALAVVADPRQVEESSVGQGDIARRKA